MYDKLKVAKAIRAMGAEFGRRWETDEVWTRRMNTGDDSAGDEIALVGCESAGISLEEYCEGIAEDPELHHLQKSLIYDVVMRDLKPGPNNPRALESAGARIPVKITGEKRWWQFWR